MRDHHYRQVLVLVGAFAFLAWAYLLVWTVRQEIRRETRAEFMLDDTGAPVEVYRAIPTGREYVWELGKGYREPTQEEKDFEGERSEP